MAIKRRRDRARADDMPDAPALPAPPGYVPPPEFRRVMTLYLRMSSKRPAGMSVEPLPSVEIEAWARRHQETLTDFEQELIDRIDAAFRSGVNAALKTDRQSEEKRAALRRKGGADNGRHR